jgi:hypothetical protein
MMANVDRRCLLRNVKSLVRCSYSNCGAVWRLYPSDKLRKRLDFAGFPSFTIFSHPNV